jgi:hypothetical protein
MRKSLGL